MTRIAACWRKGERYVLRDVDGREITEAEGRSICAERYKITAEMRAARRRPSAAKRHKQGTGRRSKGSQSAPVNGPSPGEPIEAKKVA
jgi:hypothetical protein